MIFHTFTLGFLRAQKALRGIMGSLVHRRLRGALDSHGLSEGLQGPRRSR